MLRVAPLLCVSCSLVFDPADHFTDHSDSSVEDASAVDSPADATDSTPDTNPPDASQTPDSTPGDADETGCMLDSECESAQPFCVARTCVECRSAADCLNRGTCLDNRCTCDADGDGYELQACGPTFADCDDTDPSVFPGSTVACRNGVGDGCAFGDLPAMVAEAGGDPAIRIATLATNQVGRLSIFTLPGGDVLVGLTADGTANVWRISETVVTTVDFAATSCTGIGTLTFVGLDDLQVGAFDDGTPGIGVCGEVEGQRMAHWLAEPNGTTRTCVQTGALDTYDDPGLVGWAADGSAVVRSDNRRYTAGVGWTSLSQSTNAAFRWAGADHEAYAYLAPEVGGERLSIVRRGFARTITRLAPQRVRVSTADWAVPNMGARGAVFVSTGGQYIRASWGNGATPTLPDEQPSLVADAPDFAGDVALPALSFLDETRVVLATLVPDPDGEGNAVRFDVLPGTQAQSLPSALHPFFAFRAREFADGDVVDLDLSAPRSGGDDLAVVVVLARQGATELWLKRISLCLTS